MTIFEVATDTRDTDSPPFQRTELPQIKAKAVFQPDTAQGKLKAEMTPMEPRGFQERKSEFADPLVGAGIGSPFCTFGATFCVTGPAQREK